MRNRGASLRYWVLPISLSLLVLTFGASAQDSSIKKIREFPDHTFLLEIDGQEAWAITDVARIKKLHDAEIGLPQCESDLKQTQDDLAKTKLSEQDAKNNEQDLKVRNSNVERDYDSQSQLLTTCMALTNNGSKVGSFLDKWPVKLIRDVAPSAIQMAKCK